eukprot:6421971-Amphidinium_carterae.1
MQSTLQQWSVRYAQSKGPEHMVGADLSKHQLGPTVVHMSRWYAALFRSDLLPLMIRALFPPAKKSSLTSGAK